ncbi:hypothetical protein ACQP04_11140 [Pseudonocardia halophobica]|uniref:hypothetical protein n=1 Tax=Pseudonocardia halophobica TaxID=29401 RepID=UPI003D89D6DB
MGGRSRYDRETTVDDQVLAEAEAYSTVAELLDDYRDEVIGDRTVATQVGNVLHSAAIELRAGRALPIGVRRAVRGLANALRESMDPR